MSKSLPNIPRMRNRSRLPQVGLFVTGQTTKFVDNDDGDLEVGYTRADRFVTVNSEVWYDKFTGLYWPRDSAGFGRGGLNTFNAAFTQAGVANSNVLGGFSDWRVPNIAALFSLMDYEQSSSGDHTWAEIPWVGDRPGTFVWSSTTVSWFTLSAYVANFFNGKTESKTKSNINAVIIVVRGGPL